MCSAVRTYTLAMFNLKRVFCFGRRCVWVGVAGMALVEVDAGLRAKGRKMRRNASNPDEQVQIQQVHCIRGGARRDWLVLPSMTINGRQCVPVNPFTTWLHQVLNGGCGRNAENPHHGAITNFFKECLQYFKECVRQESCAPKQGCEPSHAAGSGDAAGCGPSPPGTKRGRQAVMSDSDSDEEKEEGSSGHMKRAVRKRTIPRGEFVNAKLRGMSFCFTVISGPRLCVPIDGPWVENMVQDLLSRRDEENQHKCEAASQGRGPKMLLTETDKGRIGWRSRTSTTEAAWAICFTDKHGVEKWARAGLSVPSTALNGEPIMEEAFLNNARQVLIKARREWNRVDFSGADRFDDTYHLSPSTSG